MKHERTQSGMSKLLGWTAICMTVFGIATQATAATNPVPYIDDFESYTDGQVLAVDQGWYADEADAVSILATNYTFTGDYYLTGDHTKVLQTSSSATNMVGGSAGSQHYIDHLVQPVVWTDEALPTVPGDTQFAYYVNTNGNLQLYSNLVDFESTEEPFQAAWFDITNIVIPSNEWIRVTVEVNYESPDGGAHYNYRFWVNGTLAESEFAFVGRTDGGAWEQPAGPLPADQGDYLPPPGGTGTYFPFANGNGGSEIKLNSITVNGTGLLDDLVVTTNSTLNTGPTRTIDADAGPGGFISDQGTKTYPENATPTYTITPSNNYAILDVVINGVLHLGATNTYIFPPVTSNQIIYATFTNVAAPTMWTISNSVSTANGSISPTDSVLNGDNSTNYITADQDYYISEFKVDGTNSTPTSPYIFFNVITNHTLEASFAPTTTSNGAPHWWLRDYGLTNDFGAADTNDADGDGLTDTEEYLSSTDPTNDTSRLQVSEIVNVGGTNKFIWYSVGIDATLPPYGIEGNTNLNNTNDWQPVETLTEDRSATNEWDVPAGTKFYRIVATNNVTP